MSVDSYGLLSLSSMLSAFIHVIIRSVRMSFFIVAEVYSMRQADHIFFIQSLDNGFLDGFHLSAVVSSAAVNIHGKALV